MEHIKSFEKLQGADVGFHSSCLHPSDGEGCVGKRGIDSSYTLEQVVALAHKMDPKPNVIVKAGPKAKWYLKQFSPENIPEEIQKQQWRDTSRSTMWIIQWE